MRGWETFKFFTLPVLVWSYFMYVYSTESPNQWDNCPTFTAVCYVCGFVSNGTNAVDTICTAEEATKQSTKSTTGKDSLSDLDARILRF